MPTQPVIEKQVVDISLGGGIDENSPEESIDWTSKFVNLVNLDIDGDSLVLRPGLQAVCSATDTGGTSIGDLVRLGVGKDGLLGFAGGSAMGVYQLEEGRPSAPALTNKGMPPRYSVTSRTVSSCQGGTGFLAGVVGVVNFTTYQAILHQVPHELGSNTGPMKLVIVDKLSGNVVKSYRIGDASSSYLTGTIVGVADRYIHLYITRADYKPKMQVIDTQSLPTSLSSYTELTGTSNDDRLAGVVALSDGSVAVVRGATCRIEKFNNSGATVSNNTVANISASGLDWNGTSFCLSGTYSGSFVYKEVDTSYSVTRTVTGPTVPATSDGEIRVAASSTTAGDVRLIAYIKEPDQNATNFPCPFVYSVGVGETSFTCTGYLPMWVEASLPVYDSNKAQYLVHMHNVMLGATNDYVANADAIINITDITGATIGEYPRVFRPEAILGNYVTSSGHPNDTTKFLDTGAALYSKGPAYRPVVGAAAVGLTFAHWDKAAATADAALSFSLDQLVDLANSPEKVHMDTDVVSGGSLCSYDGYKVQEHGFVCAPTITVKEDTGTGIVAGVYNYVAVFSYRDYTGKLHVSRVSRPRSITLASEKVVDVEAIVPTVTLRPSTEKMFVSLYRTTNAGTQYHLVEQRTIASSAGTTTDPSNEVYVNFTDNVPDATLSGKPLLYRQPGTIGTALDRYHALAASHVVHHKDRVFYSNGTNIYYSSFAVDGEAYWFNPVFTLAVPGGQGNIVGLASMDGILVVFKRDSVFLIDGDGPPENGGNGIEFSTPRKIHTEYGCIDARTIVNVPMGIMYRSQRGIELLKRNGQVDFIGQAVSRTTDSYTVPYGAAFDRNTGRVMFPCSTSGGTWVTLVYSVTEGGWTKYTHFGGSGYIYDICFARSVDDNGTKGDRIYMAAQSRLTAEDSSNSIDYISSDVFIPFTIETGWVRAASKQDRIRVTDLFFTGQRQSNHNLKCQFYSDYNRSTATTIKTFTAAETDLTPEMLNFQPSKESVQAMKFKVTSETPTVQTSIGNGKQVSVVGLTVRVGLKGGGVKAPVAQKG